MLVGRYFSQNWFVLPQLFLYVEEKLYNIGFNRRPTVNLLIFWPMLGNSLLVLFIIFIYSDRKQLLF